MVVSIYQHTEEGRLACSVKITRYWVFKKVPSLLMCFYMALHCPIL